MKKLLFIIAVLALPFGRNLQAQIPCAGYGWGPASIPKISLLGDSRAGFLALSEMPPNNKNWINHASISFNGTVYPVIPGEQMDSVWDFGWFGKTSEDWDNALDHCRAIGHAVKTTPKIVINLGGNDMKSYYQVLERLEAEYILLNAILNPKSALQALLGLARGSRDNFVENWWYWNYEVKEDSIVSHMDSVVYKLMNQNGNSLDTANEVIIVDVAPVLGTDVGDIALFSNFHKFLRINVYLSRLNVKYYNRLVPNLAREHGSTRVGFLDLFNPFLGNILNGGLSYYWDPSSTFYPGDGIHFSDPGNQQFGLILASKMALPKTGDPNVGGMGWFTKNSNLNDATLADLANNVPPDLSYLLPVVPGGGGCDINCIILCYLFC